MTNNNISTALPNEAAQVKNLNDCQKCGAAWEAGRGKCLWCGADESGTQILQYNFHFPQIDAEKSRWSQARPVPGGKAAAILLLAAVFGAILYLLLPIVLALSMVARMVILILLIYALVSLGLAYGVSALFKRLINVWGKGNSSWLIWVTALVIFVPAALRNTIVFWSAGGVQGFMSLIMGCAIPILGLLCIAMYYSMAGSGKFCPYCDTNVYLRENVMKVHSCPTTELVQRIGENAPKSTLLDLNTPEISKHAFTSVDLFLCKKPGCRHAQINVYQHMMHMTYSKQNNQMQENDEKRLIAEHEIAGETFDSWSVGWDKKDSLA